MAMESENVLISNNILAHPTQFCQKMPQKQRQDALKEYKAIIRSNALSLLSAWMRQTRYDAVRAALESYFQAEIWGRVRDDAE